jgi:hypothetical protein
MSIASGGMGKNELSAKDTQKSACGAFRWVAIRIVQS